MSAQDLMQELNVSLSDTQAKKLMKGGTIQLNPAQFAGPGKLLMDKKKAMKLMRAVQKGKGMRVSLTPQEIETMRGAGLWDLIKKGAKWLKDNNLIRPILKAGVKYALPLAAGVFGTPAAAAAVTTVTEKYGDDAVDKIGDTLGFGFRGGAAMKGKMKGGAMKGKMKGRAKVVGGAMKSQAPSKMTYKPIPQLDNSALLLPPVSAAMNPVQGTLPDQSLARLFPRGMSKSGMLSQMGGSFKLAGT